MALQIGTFYDKGRSLEGTIETRKLAEPGTVTIVPHDKSKDSAPDYLVMAGRFQIGRAWKQTTREGTGEYLNLLLDNPHFDEPLSHFL